MRFSFILSLSLACGSALANGWVDPSGKALPDSESRKSTGDFIAQSVVVSDVEKFLADWETPSTRFNVTEVTQVKRNSPLTSFVIFAGCAPDSAGMCNVTMRIHVIAPDGAVYADTPDMEVWRGRPEPEDRSLQLSVGYLKMVIEAGEQLGKYRIETTVRDNNKGSELTLRKVVTALETP